MVTTAASGKEEMHGEKVAKQAARETVCDHTMQRLGTASGDWRLGPWWNVLIGAALIQLPSTLCCPWGSLVPSSTRLLH